MPRQFQLPGVRGPEPPLLQLELVRRLSNSDRLAEWRVRPDLPMPWLEPVTSTTLPSIRTEIPFMCARCQCFSVQIPMLLIQDLGGLLVESGPYMRRSN